MKARLLLWLISIALLCGCASTNDIMKSWEGQHQSNLLAKWGPPSQTIADGSGGHVWIYTAQRQFQTAPATATTTMDTTVQNYGNTSYGYGRAITTFNPAQTAGWQAYRMFWINSDGVIYRWAWKGM
jgi:hypothetical protein